MSDKLINVEIPEANAKLILERLGPFFDKYFREQKRQAKSPYKLPKLFGIRELVISAYHQGLTDGFEIGTQTNQK